MKLKEANTISALSQRIYNAQKIIGRPCCQLEVKMLSVYTPMQVAAIADFTSKAKNQPGSLQAKYFALKNPREELINE